MGESWVERHRPRRLQDVVGNAQALKAITRWADQWENGPPRQRALLLAGAPGCGKTSTAHALAAERGWGLIELNASDARSRDVIQRVAGQGALHETFSADGEYFSSREGKRKLIVLDEADNLYERGDGATDAGTDYSDKGGKRAIVDTVETTQQPIILIVNDEYALKRGSGSRLGRLTLRVPFQRPAAPTVVKVLERVSSAEGVRASPQALDAIAQRAQGDLRSAVNDLQALCEGRDRLEAGDLAALGYRDRTQSVFNALRTILRGTEAQAAIRSTWDLDEAPPDLLPWVDENLPKEFHRPADLAAAYGALASADVFLGRTRRRNAYTLWRYASEMMTGGVAAARTQRPGPFVRYTFPAWIRQMASSKGVRAVRDQTAEKVGAHAHASKRIVVRDMLPWLRRLFLADREFAERFSLDTGLIEDEIAFVYGPDADESLVRDVVAHVEGRREEGPRQETEFFAEAEHTGDDAGPADAEDESPVADDAAEAPAKTLFDF